MKKIEYDMNVFLFWYCFILLQLQLHKLTFLFVLQAAVHSDVDKDMNSLFLEFCSKLLDAILCGLHRQEVHLGSKNLVDILFANPYDSTRSYRFV